MLEKLPDSVGHALINQRAGMEHVTFNQLHKLGSLAALRVESPSFTSNGRLPTRFTGDGIGVSPALQWTGVPTGTEMIAVMVEDADSPTPHPLVHAIIVKLPGVDGSIEESALESPGHPGIGLTTGQNSLFKHAWLPPDPPPGHGEHRYVFQVFALRAGESLPRAPGRRAFIALTRERAIAAGYVVGTYQRMVNNAAG